MKKLFDAVTADDTTTNNAFVTDGARRLTVQAFGTFGGGTITVYMSLNGAANGVTTTDLTFTADAITTLDLADGVTVWATLAGSSGASASLFISGIGSE